MPIVTEPVRCPQIESEQWLNGGLVRIAAGAVVLVDFWDYTCVNCLNTLPYLREWHARYRDKGLAIAGVHAPEFAFARGVGHVRRAIADLAITWPVAIDNDYRIWQSYANRYWPAKYLADARGYLRHTHHGEGAYAETEAAIQALIREIRPWEELPEPLPALRERDLPGAVCFRPTPELYLGYRRGVFGNLPDPRVGVPVVLERPATLQANAAYLAGPWTLQDEYAEGGADASLAVRYQAAEVNAVLHLGDGRRLTVAAELDGGPLPRALWGEDVHEDGGETVLVVDAPRMYRLVKGAVFAEHELALRPRGPGLRAYAFTFVSCVGPEA